MQEYEVVINSRSDNVMVGMKELIRYKDLIIMFVKKNFKLIYKQTILGPLWLIINPLFTSVIFTFVFGSFAGISTDGAPSFLFYMAGNTMWGLFSSSVTGTANTFVGNASVFGKIYFPRLTVPISQAITALLNFLIQFALLLIIYVYYYIIGANVSFSLSTLTLPLLLFQAVLLGLGVGIIISSLTTKYRDLAIAVGFGMQLWMYLTPIVYPLSSTGGVMYKILLLNPMTPIIHNFRHALLGTDSFLLAPWALSWVVTILLLFLGIRLFSKIERTFMDTV